MSRSAAVGRLRHRVGEAIVRHRLWAAGDRVAVAVSGGLDSVVLLDVLHQTARWHGGRLEVVTIDHGIHPEASAHADTVVARAGSLGLVARRISLGLSASASEAEARDARYRALGALDVDRVALGHHQDDLAETVLLHLLRGTGTRGLAGMARRRGPYVRPLLDIPRTDLLRWAQVRGLHWVEDPTNADPRYLRNRIRHEVMPLLEALRPGAAKAMARSARVAAEDDRALDEAADADRALDVSWLASAPRALAGRALRARMPEAGAAHVDAILDLIRRGTGEVTLPGGRRVTLDSAARRLALDGRRRHTPPLD